MALITYLDEPSTVITHHSRICAQIAHPVFVPVMVGHAEDVREVRQVGLSAIASLASIEVMRVMSFLMDNRQESSPRRE